MIELNLIISKRKFQDIRFVKGLESSKFKLEFSSF